MLSFLKWCLTLGLGIFTASSCLAIFENKCTGKESSMGNKIPIQELLKQSHSMKFFWDLGSQRWTLKAGLFSQGVDGQVEVPDVEGNIYNIISKCYGHHTHTGRGYPGSRHADTLGIL